MADKTLSMNTEPMEEALQRLSRKPGVKAWIMIDRTSGAVLKTNGQISAIRPPKTSSAAQGLPNSTAGSFSADPNAATSNETQAAQELAAMVWNFMNTAGSLVEEMDTEDELKLLRLRTKKQELVIVPETKYLLVVVHDTPPA